MRTGHLFAGGGGGLYADLILGHTPVFAVEWDAYACAILRSRAADGWFPGLRVHEGDVRLFDPSEYTGAVDCIHAGFPCQDISLAGGGEGIDGARSGLYREVLRVADAIRPRYLFLENVGAIVSRGLGTVLGDLAARGYDARWTCLAASEVGAPHKRDRWWCLAYSRSGGSRSGPERSGREAWANLDRCSPWTDMANAEGQPIGPGLCPDEQGGDDLITAVVRKTWTTPCADDTGHRKAKFAQGGSPLSFQAGGSLNPTWVAWLMGWPLEATRLKPSEMAKFPSARRRPGKSSEAPNA